MNAKIFTRQSPEIQVRLYTRPSGSFSCWIRSDQSLGRGGFGIASPVKEAPCNQVTQLSQVVKKNSLHHLSSITGPRKLKPCDKELVQERQVYVMKAIGKSDMLRNCQEGYFRGQRDFLIASEKSQWIVPLASFRDTNNLYLVMDYRVDGDFLSLLLRKCAQSEKASNWYLAEIILCIEEMQQTGLDSP